MAFGVSSYGSGQRTDVVNQYLEFGTFLSGLWPVVEALRSKKFF